MSHHAPDWYDIVTKDGVCITCSNYYISVEPNKPRTLSIKAEDIGIFTVDGKEKKLKGTILVLIPWHSIKYIHGYEEV